MNEKEEEFNHDFECSAAESEQRLIGYFTALLTVKGIIDVNPKYKGLEAVRRWADTIFDENINKPYMKAAQKCYSKLFEKVFDIKE